MSCHGCCCDTGGEQRWAALDPPPRCTFPPRRTHSLPTLYSARPAANANPPFASRLCCSAAALACTMPQSNLLAPLPAPCGRACCLVPAACTPLGRTVIAPSTGNAARAFICKYLGLPHHQEHGSNEQQQASSLHERAPCSSCFTQTCASPVTCLCASNATHKLPGCCSSVLA